jgi:pimeloyl-ACP methyl ester carboxylesterase
MRRINGDGIGLSVYDEGEGPAVLLLHGFPRSVNALLIDFPT